MTNPTEYVPVRLRQDQLVAMDRAVKALGSSRSEFVRMAVAERLQRLEQIVSALQQDVDGISAGVVPPDSEYHDSTGLSINDENDG